MPDTYANKRPELMMQPASGTLVFADDLIDPLHGFRGKPQVGRLHVEGRATHDGSELVPVDVNCEG